MGTLHRELLKFDGEKINWDKENMAEYAAKAETMAAEREGAKAVEGAKADEEAEAKRLAESLRDLIKEGATDDCSICVGDLTHPVITPCAHVFCLNCITTWLQRGGQPPPGCPLCRLPVNVRQLLEAASNNEEEVDDGGDSDGDEDGFEDIVVEVSSTKINAVLKELAAIRKENPKTKTVVVSQFTSLLSMLQPLLENDGFRYTRLDGTMSTRTRSDVIAEFQDRVSASAPTVLLLSLRAGGVGLNLTSAKRGAIQIELYCHFLSNHYQYYH